MNPKNTGRLSKPAFVLTAVMLLACGRDLSASESDLWTYAHIPLSDSSALVSVQLQKSLQTVINTINARPIEELHSLDDTALEFAFFTEFKSRYIRDVAWGMFEKCIGTNNCSDWPQFERIQMYPEESIYYAARWRFIPSRFHLASVVQVCGIRMGADKLTHFFDDAFHYFNALRSKRNKFEPDDIRQLSLTFEETYMGTRLTGIVSYADIEANLAGVQFYSDFFTGNSPMIGRDQDGRLKLIRKPDICNYVSEGYDERILPNEFTYSLLDTTRARQRTQDLQRIIAARAKYSASQASALSAQELHAQKTMILARRIPMTRWQSDFPKIRMVGHAAGMTTQWIFDSNFRQVSNLFGFDPLKPHKLDDRIPINIRRVESTYSTE
ncbi:MAG: hypothetical protein OES20_10715 [Gammaproteobacteria bacterium]|nr:hypothetical protein [Gammaproteobacteria bacterium]MDH3856903.1 hypothetical protein [Gammaproteobacteria bacterium]